MIDGSTTGSAFTVKDTGTLGGSGTLNGSGIVVTVENGGKLAPGTLVGKLNTGGVQLQSGSQFVVQINGDLTAGVDYDQLNVTGTVDLTGAILVATGSIAAVSNQQVILINNDGNSDPVTGTFAGLDEGVVFTAGSTKFQTTYQGGDGNDVVLTAISANSPTLQGTPGNDVFLVEIDPANSNNVRISLDTGLGPQVIWSTLLSDLASLTIDGLAGDDTLKVDFSGGNPIPGGGIFFDGGDPTAGSGDKLLIERGTSTGLFNTVTHTFTTSASGSVALDPDGPERSGFHDYLHGTGARCR